MFPCVTESNWLNKLSAITEKPKVTIAKNHAFNRTHAKPISKPMPAETKPPTSSTEIRTNAAMGPVNRDTPKALERTEDKVPPKSAEAKPPKPRNTA